MSILLWDLTIMNTSGLEGVQFTEKFYILMSKNLCHECMNYSCISAPKTVIKIKETSMVLPN